MKQPDFELARQYALARLENELDPRLSYHSLAHTRDDVLPAVTRLALLAGIGVEERLLLETAALYHDIGYVESRFEHESISARLAAAALPAFGFSQSQVATITDLILATKVPQSPKTYLGALLCDADLDSLGREDFFTLSKRLHRELGAYGQSLTIPEWYSNQLQFLQNHAYLTPAAAQLRGAGKRKNIAAVKKRLEKLSSSPSRSSRQGAMAPRPTSRL